MTKPLEALISSEIADFFAGFVEIHTELGGPNTVEEAQCQLTERVTRIATECEAALIAALEQAQQDISELRDGFIANQEEACEAIKYTTELKEQLSRAIKCRDEAINEMDGMQKSLDHTHQCRALWRAKAESAEKRIAELESTLEREREKSRRVMSRNQQLEASQLAAKLPDEYPDDGELSFCIDLYDEPEGDLRLAMWLKELRRRRSGTVGGE